jgi:hypothetical protein
VGGPKRSYGHCRRRTEIPEAEPSPAARPRDGPHCRRAEVKLPQDPPGDRYRDGTHIRTTPRPGDRGVPHPWNRDARADRLSSVAVRLRSVPEVDAEIASRFARTSATSGTVGSWSLATRACRPSSRISIARSRRSPRRASTASGPTWTRSQARSWTSRGCGHCWGMRAMAM